MLNRKVIVSLTSADNWYKFQEASFCVQQEILAPAFACCLLWYQQWKLVLFRRKRGVFTLWCRLQAGCFQTEPSDANKENFSCGNAQSMLCERVASRLTRAFFFPLKAPKDQ